jgi:hypothetical protein
MGYGAAVAWRRAIAASLIWLFANAAAGALFAFAVQPLLAVQSFYVFYVAGLFAGCVFGLAQWLALRPFFRDVRFWAPVTIGASLISWSLALMFAAGTFGFGGWLGGAFSAAAQSVLLALSARNDDLSLRLSLVLWIPASVIGGAVFYFCYWAALAASSPEPTVTGSAFEWIFVGSLGYAVATAPFVAVLVAVAGRKSAPKAALITS